MRFDSYIPCTIIKLYVKTFIISETIEEKTYKALPDNSLVIGFQYRGNLSLLVKEQHIKLNSSGLSGLQDSYRIFKNSANIGTVLVYFNEAGASTFFKQPIHELFGESVSLDNFMLRSELVILEEQLCEAKKDTDRIKFV